MQRVSSGPSIAGHISLGPASGPRSMNALTMPLWQLPQRSCRQREVSEGRYHSWASVVRPRNSPHTEQDCKASWYRMYPATSGVSRAKYVRGYGEPPRYGKKAPGEMTVVQSARGASHLSKGGRIRPSAGHRNPTPWTKLSSVARFRKHAVHSAWRHGWKRGVTPNGCGVRFSPQASQ